MSVVDHVGRIASRWAHVYFQGHEITDVAKAGTVAVETEELQMYEAAHHAEGLHCTTA